VEKITSLKKVIDLSKKLKHKGKTVGLVLGSFDVLHMGHINLFRFAKKRADFLIVGLDNDKTIRNTKGKPRPVNNYKRRSSFLTELSSVDAVFQITKVFKHGDEASHKYIKELFRKINPTYLFTSINCDRSWKDKKKYAEAIGIKFIPDKSKTVTHSSEILKKLETNF
jgi:cytidyltransferase-like protein